MKPIVGLLLAIGIILSLASQQFLYKSLKKKIDSLAQAEGYQWQKEVISEGYQKYYQTWSVGQNITTTNYNIAQ